SRCPCPFGLYLRLCGSSRCALCHGICGRKPQPGKCLGRRRIRVGLRHPCPCLSGLCRAPSEAFRRLCPFELFRRPCLCPSGSSRSLCLSGSFRCPCLYLCLCVLFPACLL